MDFMAEVQVTTKVSINKDGRPRKKNAKRRGGVSRSPVTKEIFRIFIAPLLNEFFLSPQNADNPLHAKLELFFCKPTRHIWLFRVVKPFKMLGPAWMTPDTPQRMHVDGAGDRDAKPGDPIYVRFDSTKSGSVDIEFKEQIFVMNLSDWQVLSEKCEEIC